MQSANVSRTTLSGPIAIVVGVLTIAVLATIARIAAPFAGPIPDVVIGLILGALIGNTIGVPAALKPGVAFVLRYVLRAAIVLFGLGLSLSAVVKTGGATLLLVVACFFVAMGLGWLTARVFKLGAKVGTLIASGTAICGGSAILAIGPLIQANDEEIAYALSTIFAFNIVALIVYPFIGHGLRLSDNAFGAWTGTAVNDTSVVVATGYAYSHAAGATATIVKLTRTLFLVPLALGIGLMAGQRQTGSLAAKLRKTIPWFIVFFVLAAGLRSANVVPDEGLAWASKIASFLIVMVLAAVGLNVNVSKMASLGPMPFVAGFSLATVMAVISYSLVMALQIH
jgi:uncharacterized integral membrane protein (TIGR00698 family)